MSQQTRDQNRTADAQVSEGGMPAGQAPAAQNAQTPAVQMARDRARGAMAKMLEAVDVQQHEIANLLQPFGVTYEFFRAGLYVGLRSTLVNDRDFFVNVTPDSFMNAVLKIAMLGLVADGKLAAIARFKEVATAMIMVEGFVKVLTESGVVVSINHNVVRSCDIFEHEQGDSPKVRHVPPLKRAPDAQTIGAWCLVKTNMAGEGSFLEVVDDVDLKKIASTSRSTGGPRKEWADEMHRKAPFRRLVKRLPKTKRLSDLIATDDENYSVTPIAGGAEGADRATRAAAVPDKQLFGGQSRSQQEEPKDDADRPDAPVYGDASDDWPIPDGDGEDPEIVASLFRVISGAENEAEVDQAVEDIVQGPHFTTLSEGTKTRLTKAVEDKKAALAQPKTGETAGDDQPAFRVLLSSSDPEPRVFTDPKEWSAAILTKLSALKAEPAVVFWKRNAEFIEAAKKHSPKEAARVLGVGAGRGLTKEHPGE